MGEDLRIRQELTKDLLCRLIDPEQNVRESLKAIDRGYVLENGSLVLEDTAEGLLHNPHVISSYLGI